MIADRNERELLMSLGAAITSFRVAAAHFGFESTVAYETRPNETLPVATISVRKTRTPNLDLARRFPAIRKRHMNRKPYDHQPLEPAAMQAICDVVDASPDTLRLILPRDTERVAECVARRDAELTRSASMLLLVTSDQDQESLVKAGETLELLLLTVTLLGLQYSFLSAPLEVDEPREQLRLLIGNARAPQLLLRIGSAA